MRKLIRLVLFIICVLTAYPSYAFSFDGPLQVKNQYPIFLHVNQPYLEKASAENSLSLSLSHSSTYTVQSSGHWDINLDMEITELNLRYKRYIKDYFELGVDLPLVWFSDGFMDGFLDWYHGTFGLPDYGRENRPLHEFLYEVRRDGNLIVEGETGMGLGDVRLTIKKPVISSEGFNLSVKGDLELPTGSAKKGYGNGSVDAGVSILADKRLSKGIMAYGNLGYVFSGDVRGHQKIGLEDFLYGGLAIEADVGRGVNLIAQIQGQSSIYPKTDLLAVDRDAWFLSIGGRCRSFELSLTEDINAAGAPDFILNLSYKIKL